MYFEVLMRPPDSPYEVGSILTLEQVALVRGKDLISFEHDANVTSHFALTDMGYAFKILESPMGAGVRTQDDEEFLSSLRTSDEIHCPHVAR